MLTKKQIQNDQENRPQGNLNTQNKNILSALEPEKHTNTGYLTKIMRENHSEIQEMKKIFSDREEEVIRLRANLKTFLEQNEKKTEEVQRLNLIIKNQQQRFDMNIQTKQTSNFEKHNLENKIEELTSIQKKYRAEIAEKDRIIMTYVNKSKQKLF